MSESREDNASLLRAERAARRKLFREYLATFDVECELCHYNLRGLSEPRCPECGEWTELAWNTGYRGTLTIPMMTVGPLRLFANRILVSIGGNVCNVVDYEELRSMRLLRRDAIKDPTAHVAVATGFLVVALLLMLIGVQYFITGQTYPLPAMTKPLSGFASAVLFVVLPIGFVAGGIALLAHGLSRRKIWWVRIETSARELFVPVRKVNRDELEAKLREMLRTARSFATSHADGTKRRTTNDGSAST